MYQTILENIINSNEYLGGKKVAIKALESNDDKEMFEALKYIVAMNDYCKPGLEAARDAIRWVKK